MQTNKTSPSMVNVQGKVGHPIVGGNEHRIGYDGHGRIPMVTDNTIYDYRIGGSCMGIAGDYIGPGVNLKNPIKKENNTLQAFACIGDKAKVISDDTKDREGYVAGRHGSIGYVMVHFDEETPELATTEDKVPIKAYERGLELIDRGGMQLMNIDPVLFEGLGIVGEKQGIKMPVMTYAPAYLMGSGLGSTITMLGDYDIITQDTQANKEFGISGLHFDNLVMIQDHDNRSDPHYYKGATSVDTVVYTDSYTSGYDPGLVVIMNSRYESIGPILGPNANTTNYLHMK